MHVKTGLSIYFIRLAIWHVKNAFLFTDSRLWDCRVVTVESVTHNCKLLCCELPDGVIMRVPVGYHIHMTRDVEGILCSTTIDKSMFA